MHRPPTPNRPLRLSADEPRIKASEDALRSWFTRGSDPISAQIDGLDIGWGGVQQWATARMPPLGDQPHLDFACGYATFLAQLGWRFPDARLVGLNIDFEGPHALAGKLLREAGVHADLVRADARRMPFRNRTFGSVSCFLGLQDIEIGFDETGVREALSEAARVLRESGALILLDDFTFDRVDSLLRDVPVSIVDRSERSLDVRWDRTVAERAIAVYADGWLGQIRDADPEKRERIRIAVYQKMREDMIRQLDAQGFYTPFGPTRMIVARKTA